MADILERIQIDRSDYRRDSVIRRWKDNGDGTWTPEGGESSGGGGTDSDGNPLPSGFDYLAETYAYDGSGNVQTIAKTSGANTYTQTLTYTDGQLTGISKWVKS